MAGNESHHAASIVRARELLKKGLSAEAEELLRGAILQIELELGSEAPELMSPLYLYAKSLSRQHPWNTLPFEERNALERALRLAVVHHGEDAPRTVRIRETLAAGLHAADETDPAAVHMALVVSSKERTHGEGLVLAHALNGLADMHLQLQHYSQAASLYERSAAMASGKGDEVMDFTIWFGHGRALMGLERYQEAILLLDRAHAWFLSKYGERNRCTAELRTLLDSARRHEGSDG